jgi:hypothetical protein
MSDEDGIRRTIAKYCQLFDSKKWDELAEIFADIPGQGERDP